MRAMIVPFAPTQRLETAGLFFVAALNSARQRIWLSAPYFVPDEAVMKALELASLRGVDVRIITTGKADSLPGLPGCVSLYRSAPRPGHKVFMPTSRGFCMKRSC